MKLMEVKCPNCGSQLQVEGSKGKQITCSYCNANFLLDDDTSVVKHIMAGQISEEQEFINAETNLNKFKDYDASFRGYRSLSERYVDNKEIWIGLLRSKTHDFTLKYCYDSHKIECDRYFNKFKVLATPEEVEKYEAKYNNYLEEYKVNEKEIYGNDYVSNYSDDDERSPEVMCLVTFFLGYFGVHKFMEGKFGMGVLYLLTWGLFGIGWFYDVIMSIVKLVKKYKN